MNVSSILTTPQTSLITKSKAEKAGEDFAAVLQGAMNSRGGSMDTVDTFESASENISPTTRNAINRSRKLDENGQPFDAAVRTTHDEEEFRSVFHEFVGKTLYGQMLKSMRETQEKPAYFHGGRAEEIFQEQLDNVLVDKMTAVTSRTLSDTMFQLMK